MTNRQLTVLVGTLATIPDVNQHIIKHVYGRMITGEDIQFRTMLDHKADNAIVNQPPTDLLTMLNDFQPIRNKTLSIIVDGKTIEEEKRKEMKEALNETLTSLGLPNFK
ncbi:hypothetical protein ACKGJO_06505 [Gracilimonas sp. Q87]|uniref:hypothetical protein n=1 Tax=Gracilimonas sp. Q87 TaxID=3384766 RepID=UPI00398436A4